MVKCAKICRVRLKFLKTPHGSLAKAIYAIKYTQVLVNDNDICSIFEVILVVIGHFGPILFGDSLFGPSIGNGSPASKTNPISKNKSARLQCLYILRMTVHSN